MFLVKTEDYLSLSFGRAPTLRYGSPPYGVRFAPCFAPLRALQAAHAEK
jgi:hypothetical protein